MNKCVKSLLAIMLWSGASLAAISSPVALEEFLKKDVVTIQNNTDADISGTFMYMVLPQKRKLPKGQLGVMAPQIYTINFNLASGKKLRRIGNSKRGAGKAYKLTVNYQGETHKLHEHLKHENQLAISISEHKGKLKLTQRKAR